MRLRPLRRCVLVLGLSAILVSKAFAVYDPSGSGGKFGKRWIVTGDLRAGYDDNTTTATVDPEGSAFGEVSASGSYSYPTDTTFSSVRIGASGTQYISRPDSAFDFATSLDTTFSHTFTPRLNLDTSDHFRFAQEPQIAENNVISRRQGDHVSNAFNSGLSYEYSPRWFSDFSVFHELWDYRDELTALTLDRQSFGASPGIRHRLSEKTTLGLNYHFARVDYKDSPRDADTHTLTAEWNQSITRRWNSNVELGGSVRREDNDFSDDFFYTPFVSLSTTYLLSTTANVTGGIRYSFQETDIGTYLESRALLAYLRTSWKFAKGFTWDNGIDFVGNQMTDPVFSGLPDVDERTVVLSEKVSWKFTEHMGVFFSYSFTKFDSDLANRSYDRNIVTLGSSILF
jgi:hypothetical protein